MGSERSRIHRHADRAAGGEEAAILAQGLVAHVGFQQQGQPFVIPFSYHYDPAEPARLYLHGSPGNRTLRHLGAGAPCCVTVTLVDGLVYSRSAMFHSMNYRSVVVFGRACRVVEPGRRAAILEALIRRYFPGRGPGDYEPASDEDLRATELVEVSIEEWSAKARRGGPKGPLDSQTDAPGTCGVIALPPGTGLG